MKLDATDVRYLSSEEFRVLTAVEMGSKNHEVVPSSLIAQISSLRHAGISKLLSNLAKRKLVARVQNNMYDGYRLTYGGYDFLAVRALSKRKSVYAIGNQIGIGKESDIYIVSTEDGEKRVLKIHRLGRISFRKIKEKRDYMGKRKSASWMYMSRLAAEKEFAFMKILYEHGFPVPTPIDQARHTILMSYEDAYPLRQISSLPLEQIQKLYAALMALIVRLARAGLIHGDFNEFNLLIREIYPDSEYESDEADSANDDSPADTPMDPVEILDHGRVEQGKGVQRIIADPIGPDEIKESDQDDSEDDDDVIELGDGVQVEPILIDFPQMVSIQHPNADYYFNRDVECVRRFFRKRFRFNSSEFPRFEEVMASIDKDETQRLDALSRASGYGETTKDDKMLESHFSNMHLDPQKCPHLHESDSIGDEEDEEEEFGRSSFYDDEDSDLDEDGSEGPESEEEDDDDGAVEDPSDVGDGATSATPKRSQLDPSHVSSRVAAARAHAQRRAQKHHGRKSQATKTGRRHGGGKAKYNSSRAVADSLSF